MSRSKNFRKVLRNCMSFMGIVKGQHRKTYLGMGS